MSSHHIPTVCGPCWRLLGKYGSSKWLRAGQVSASAPPRGAVGPPILAQAAAQPALGRVGENDTAVLTRMWFLGLSDNGPAPRSEPRRTKNSLMLRAVRPHVKVAGRRGASREVSSCRGSPKTLSGWASRLVLGPSQRNSLGSRGPIDLPPACRLPLAAAARKRPTRAFRGSAAHRGKLPLAPSCGKAI